MKTVVIKFASILVISIFAGCSSSGEPSPENKSESGLALEQAEKIIEKRNAEIVIDIGNITRVTAIIAKDMQNIKNKIAQSESFQDTVKDNNKEITSLQKTILKLQNLLQENKKQFKGVIQRIHDVENYISKTKANLHDSKIKKEAKELIFTERIGKLKIKSLKANLRTLPIIIDTTKEKTVNRDTILEFKGVNDKWYKLKNNLYVSSSIVCEECIKDGIDKKMDVPIDKIVNKITDNNEKKDEIESKESNNTHENTIKDIEHKPVTINANIFHEAMIKKGNTVVKPSEKVY